MLSSYFFARRAQEETRLRQAAEARIQTLEAQLARANGARRRPRLRRKQLAPCPYPLSRPSRFTYPRASARPARW